MLFTPLLLTAGPSRAAEGGAAHHTPFRATEQHQQQYEGSSGAAVVPPSVVELLGILVAHAPTCTSHPHDDGCAPNHPCCRDAAPQRTPAKGCAGDAVNGVVGVDHVDYSKYSDDAVDGKDAVLEWGGLPIMGHDDADAAGGEVASFPMFELIPSSSSSSPSLSLCGSDVAARRDLHHYAGTRVDNDNDGGGEDVAEVEASVQYVPRRIPFSTLSSSSSCGASPFPSTGCVDGSDIDGDNGDNTGRAHTLRITMPIGTTVELCTSNTVNRPTATNTFTRPPADRDHGTFADDSFADFVPISDCVVLGSGAFSTVLLGRRLRQGQQQERRGGACDDAVSDQDDGEGEEEELVAVKCIPLPSSSACCCCGPSLSLPSDGQATGGNGNTDANKNATLANRAKGFAMGDLRHLALMAHEVWVALGLVEGARGRRGGGASGEEPAAEAFSHLAAHYGAVVCTPNRSGNDHAGEEKPSSSCSSFLFIAMPYYAYNCHRSLRPLSLAPPVGRGVEDPFLQQERGRHYRDGARATLMVEAMGTKGIRSVADVLKRGGGWADLLESDYDREAESPSSSSVSCWGGLPFRLVKHIMRDVLMALAALHTPMRRIGAMRADGDRGDDGDDEGGDSMHCIVHGDVKPANILITTTRGHRGTERDSSTSGLCCVLSDYGSARTFTAVGVGAPPRRRPSGVVVVDAIIGAYLGHHHGGAIACSNRDSSTEGEGSGGVVIDCGMGTVPYMAPEVCEAFRRAQQGNGNGKGGGGSGGHRDGSSSGGGGRGSDCGGELITPAADVWSLGITCVELLCGGALPWPAIELAYPIPMIAMRHGKRDGGGGGFASAGPTWRDLMDALPLPPSKDGALVPMPLLSDRDRAVSFIAACLTVEPSDRPSAADLLAHPFLAD